MIRKTDARSKVGMIRMNQCPAIQPTSLWSRNDFASVVRTEVGCAIFAVQPERWIELVAHAIINCQLRRCTPRILRVERVAADIVVHFERCLIDSPADIAKEKFSRRKSWRIGVDARCQDCSLRSFKIEEVQRVLMELITKLQIMPPDQLIDVIDKLPY